MLKRERLRELRRRESGDGRSKLDAVQTPCLLNQTLRQKGAEVFAEYESVHYSCIGIERDSSSFRADAELSRRKEDLIRCTEAFLGRCFAPERKKCPCRVAEVIRVVICSWYSSVIGDSKKNRKGARHIHSIALRALRVV